MISRALDFDSAKMVALLLNGGADSSHGSGAEVTDIKTRRGISILHQAVQGMNSGAVLDFLLGYGADPRRCVIAVFGVPKIRAVLQKWADRMLGQVVEHGVF